jgi:hypothetical protein
VIPKLEDAHCYVVVVWWDGKWYFYSGPAGFPRILLGVMIDGHEVALYLTDWYSNTQGARLSTNPDVSLAVPSLCLNYTRYDVMKAVQHVGDQRSENTYAFTMGKRSWTFLSTSTSKSYRRTRTRQTTYTALAYHRTPDSSLLDTI